MSSSLGQPRSGDTCGTFPRLASVNSSPHPNYTAPFLHMMVTPHAGCRSLREPTYPSLSQSLGEVGIPARIRIPSNPCHSPELHAMYPFHGQTEANEHLQPETSPASTSSQRKRTNASSPAETNIDGRKVHRVSRACDYCKSKKTRCSGTRPCDSCARRRIACGYDTQYSRGRPPTPPVGRESLDRAGDSASDGDGRIR